jgi:hypothetical protein
MGTTAGEPIGRGAGVRVALALARPAMVLARPVVDRDGRVVVGAGTALGPRAVQLLRRLAIQSVTVVADDDIAPWEREAEPAAARAEIAARFAREPASRAMDVLRDAVLRRTARRASMREPCTECGGAASEA